jgi:class 3 adenylate cyclase/tetratricopeptide (TPR) repeat protein
MIRCASCGEENPERARFCLNCGSALEAAPHPVEVRKTVTVLFADVVGSTSLGERTDPESTRRMLSRYFDVMRAVIERHGGSVEKFIGDAVMAVFGIPVLHEDDALRAVRAAQEVREAVARLNGELVGGSWSPIALRIGVNTGEVVAGEATQGHTLVTGDAVNVAARLEQAASSGEILLGETTHRLVRDAVEAEPIAPLDLKGKAEPMPAFRLTTVRDQEPMRRHDTPLVGRQRELKLLNEAFDRATEERACYLFTLLGTAGVGKSRLVHEFLGQLGDRAHVLRARCLPYGDGITFWPISELVQAAAGIDPTDAPDEALRKVQALLAETPEAEDISQRLAATIGLSSVVVPTQEAFWAVRKFLEATAADRPLIVVIDDLHWAEPTMLDLVDHVTDWSREAPILLLAIARPELLDVRPQWGGGKMNATTILLEPLDASDAGALIRNLVDDDAVAAQVQERIGDTAEGNPLFVEELVSMLVDQGVLRHGEEGWQADATLAEIRVPPTISALVAARLDHLEPPERDLIGRASVVGKTFQRTAVAELSPPERREELPARLMTLVRKELVRPDGSGAIGDEAYRFRHLLVRDAAYASLTKEQRAELHARFADWLERIAGDRLMEYEEVIAFHLEQAQHYRAELGFADALTAQLGTRAVQHLRAAGSRAAARTDMHAAGNLLARAAALTADPRERITLRLHLGETLKMTGNLAQAGDVFHEAEDAARELGDEILILRSRLSDLLLHFQTEVDIRTGEVEDVADQLEALAQAAGDRESIVRAEIARSMLFLVQCRWMDNLHALERAQQYADRDDDPRTWAFLVNFICNAVRYGPTPTDQAIERVERESVRGGWDFPRTDLATMRAMRGSFDDARRDIETAREYLTERGVKLPLGGLAMQAGTIASLTGDDEAAQREFAEGIRILQEVGEQGVLSLLAAMRAESLFRLGRRAEMEEAIALAREAGAPDDISTQANWRWVAAMAAADDGNLDEARRLMDETVEMIEPTDMPEMKASTFEALAHVELRAGRADAWRAALERALAQHTLKANLVGIARVQGELERGFPGVS